MYEVKAEIPPELMSYIDLFSVSLTECAEGGGVMRGGGGG